MTPAERLASLTRRACSVPGCITLLRSDRPSGDDTCTACKYRPACRVCAGRGTVGKDASRACYRCAGTGRQPDSQLAAHHRQSTWRSKRAA